MSRRSHYRSSKPARSGQQGTAMASPDGESPANGSSTATPQASMPASMPMGPSLGQESAQRPGMRPDAAGHLATTPPEPSVRNGNGHPPATEISNDRASGRSAGPTNGHDAARPNGAVVGAASSGPADRPPDAQQVAPAGCTAPQLRRFIKSRSWVPMHELRRRFAINGGEDDVTPVGVDGVTIFVGLPPREGRLLGELFQAGDIGYELSMDPRTPIVIGVYPMRPVPRH